MIQFTLTEITPDMAAKWIRENNEGNRAIKSNTVKRYSQDLIDGKWRVTHQCIAFDATGRLIDGQHRLSAVLLSGKPMMAYIAKYETQEETLKLPIDMQASRTIADVLEITKREQETVLAVMRFLKPSSVVTPSQVEFLMSKLRPEVDAVHRCISTTVKYRSSAPARAAIVILLKELPERFQELCHLYRAFVSMDLEGLPSSVLALIKNLDGLHLRYSGAEQRELALRIYYAFHPENRAVKMIRLLDQDAMARRIREKATWIE